MPLQIIVIAIVLVVSGCASVDSESYRAPPLVKGNWGANGWTPILKYAPEYPHAALRNNIEGWVLLEYSIEEDGTVSNVRVLDSYPPKIFDDVSIESVKKFRHKYVGRGDPKLVNGIQNVNYFEIE